MTVPADTFTVATYNIHRCHGPDGRYQPHLIAQILREIDADIIGLQEVDSGLMVPSAERRHDPERSALKTEEPFPDPPSVSSFGELPQLQYLSFQTGYQHVEGFVKRRGDGEFGNALLTRHEIKAVRRIDLTVRGSYNKRGALDVDLSVRGRPVRVMVAHLGLLMWERHFQIARLLRALGENRVDQMVIMGDFNLLLALWPKLRRFYHRLGPTPLVRTFPSWFPVLPLDRIWVQPAPFLIDLQRYQTPLTRAASDHLPVKATILLNDLKS